MAATDITTKVGLYLKIAKEVEEFAKTCRDTRVTTEVHLGYNFISFSAYSTNPDESPDEILEWVASAYENKLQSNVVVVREFQDCMVTIFVE